MGRDGEAGREERRITERGASEVRVIMTKELEEVERN